MEGSRGCHSGIETDHVGRSEGLDGSDGQIVYRGGIGHVATHAQHLDVITSEPLDGGIQGRDLDIAQYYFHTGSSESVGEGKPHARGSAGDDGYPSL